MKMQIKNKEVKKWYHTIVIDTELWANYAKLITKTKKLSPKYFAAGIYGWNYDLFEFPEFPGVAVLSGYRGFPQGINFYFKFSRYSEKYLKMNYDNRYNYSRYIRRQYIKELKKIIEN